MFIITFTFSFSNYKFEKSTTLYSNVSVTSIHWYTFQNITSKLEKKWYRCLVFSKYNYNIVIERKKIVVVIWYTSK